MNNLAIEKLEKFFSQFKTVHYKKGETFLRPGDMPQGIHFLKKGYIRLYSLSSEGQDLTLVIYKPGDFFPVVWGFTGTPSIYYFETLSPVEIQRANKEEFGKFIDENIDVFKEVNYHIIHRFQMALKRMEYLVFGNANAKLASILLICGRDFGIDTSKGREIQIPFAHKDIASLVGVTRETVSLELKKLEKIKIIGYNGRRIVIRNEKALEKEALLS
ncbi:MAG: Crp/Fnr family transcriptional regulator [Candidatus Levybacteria bacterium]|nr:Crp/Fnr family transcriptional regulator [Candidatus Levybacteria bacterium]